MPTPPKNRIEVDLKLLSDKDAKLLKEIAGDLKTIINSKMVFGNVAQQMSSAANVAGGYVAPGIYMSQEYKQKHSQTDPGKYSRQVASNYDDYLQQKKTQQARSTVGNMFERSAYSPSHKIQDQEFLNLSRYGDFTIQDMLKQISYAVGKFGFTGEEGNPNDPLRQTNRVAANVSRGFGMAAHSYPFLRSAQKISARVRSHITGKMGLGMAVGQPSTGSGVLGTPFMSPAYRTGLASSFENFKRTWGGYNPNYSSAQAQDATNAAASYGYDTGSDRGSYFVNQIGNLQRNLGLSGEQAASMLDPTMRFGTGSVSNLTNALIMMGRAAGQAGVNTQQLTLAAQEYGNQLASTFGGTTGSRMLEVAGLGTQFQSPQLGGALATNPVLNNMVVAQKGSYFKAAFSKTPQSDIMHALQTYMSPFGGNFNQLGATLKHGSMAQKDALMSNLIAAQQAGMLPGNMTATQFAQQLMRGGGKLMSSARDEDILSRVKQLHHYTPMQLHTLEKDLAGPNWKQWDTNHANDPKKIQHLSDLLAKQTQRSNTRANTRVMISLDPTAAKYIKAAVQNEQGKNAHSNSGTVEKWASSAYGIAGDVFGAASGHLGLPSFSPLG